MPERLTTEDLAQQSQARQDEDREKKLVPEQMSREDQAAGSPTGLRDDEDRVDRVDTAGYGDERRAEYGDEAQAGYAAGAPDMAPLDTAPDRSMEQSVTEAGPMTDAGRTGDTGRDDAPLFGQDEAGGYRDEWRTLQADFVDNPQDTVRRADELVAQVMQSLATTFADHKRSLEDQWHQGERVDTEELRQALRRYRSFFNRLLSV